MRILITGCRDWYDPDMAEAVLARLIARHGAGITIVHGGAEGVDRSFAEACGELDIEQEVHAAKWQELGKRAGPVRNAEMVDAGAVMCLAFHRDLMNSLGTLGCVKLAIAAGIPTYACSDETATPVRVTTGWLWEQAVKGRGSWKQIHSSAPSAEAGSEDTPARAGPRGTG